MDTVKSLRIFSLVGTVVPAAIVSVIPLAQAAALTHWIYDPTANQLEVTIQAGATPRYFLMAQPARIVVDLPNTDLGAVTTQQTYSGVIRQIRVSQFQPGVTRMVLELSPDAVLAPGQVQLEKVGAAPSSGHDRWILRPLLAQATPTLPTAASSPSPPAIAPASTTVPLPPLAPPLSPPPPPAPSAEARSSSPEPPASAPTPIAVPPAATIENPPAPTPIPSGIGGTQPHPPSTNQTTVAIPPTSPPASSADTDSAIDTTSGIEIAVPPPGTAISQVSRNSPTDAAAPVPVTASPATPLASTATAQSPTTPTATALPPLAPPLLTTPPTSVPLAPPLTTSPASSLPPLAPPLPANSVTPLAPSLPAVASDPPSTLPTPTTPSVSVNVPGRSLGSSPTVKVSIPAASVTPANLPKMPQVTQSIAELDLPSTLPSAKPAENTSATITVPSLGSPAPAPAPPQPSNSSSKPLPSVNGPAVGAPSVNIPPLSAPASTPLPPAAVESPAIVNQPTPQPVLLPTATTNNNPAPTISVPPLQPTAAPTPIAGSNASAAELIRPPAQAPATAIIPFGQPLPTTTSALPPGNSNYPNGFGQTTPSPIPGVLLPAGMMLNLIYPGTVALQLEPGTPRQEVLLLQADLRDASGQVVVPAGSTVFGRFETSNAGSQFIAQAITLQGRNVPIVAQSEAIGGSPKISESRIAINSGIGALAGGLVSQFSGWGLLGGAATGAAVTYFTSPRPAVIQPGQIVPVRVMQNL